MAIVGHRHCWPVVLTALRQWFTVLAQPGVEEDGGDYLFPHFDRGCARHWQKAFRSPSRHTALIEFFFCVCLPAAYAGQQVVFGPVGDYSDQGVSDERYRQDWAQDSYLYNF